MKTNSKNENCQIHGASAKAGNRALISLLLIALSVIVWHVWVYGPSSGPLNDPAQKSFVVLLGSEIWGLIFSKTGILAELYDIAVYFMIGIFLAGLIRTYKLTIKLRNSLVKYKYLSIVMASFVGILTPLCACGILTTVITLLFAGLPLAPAMALLVSSPLISPSTYLITLSDLGPQWTVIRIVAAFMMGMFAGFITLSLRRWGFQTALLMDGAVPEGNFHDKDYPDGRLRCNCKEKFGNRVAAKTNNMFIIFLAKSSDMFLIVGKYILVGITIGAIVNRYIPSSWMYSLFSRGDDLNIVWITLGAVPVFLHQISASSILYNIKDTISGTLNGGAGLAFLIGGPVTAVPTMIMLWTMFKKRVFFLFMFICIFGTIFLSYSFQYLVFPPNVDIDNPILMDAGSISGGESTIIEKTGKDVRFVMDPGGKGLIAVSDNYLDGTGVVVFDAGFERFLNTGSAKHDNGQYILNIAKRLEDNNASEYENNILVYNTFHNSGHETSLLNGIAVNVFEGNEEFRIAITDRIDAPEITAQMLEGYSQLWLFFGESGSRNYFSPEEMEAVKKFVDDGRGLFIVNGKHNSGVARYWESANEISSAYGVQFTGTTENRESLRVSSMPYFVESISEILRKIFRLMS